MTLSVPNNGSILALPRVTLLVPWALAALTAQTLALGLEEARLWAPKNFPPPSHPSISSFRSAPGSLSPTKYLEVRRRRSCLQHQIPSVFSRTYTKMAEITHETIKGSSCSNSMLPRVIGIFLSRYPSITMVPLPPAPKLFGLSLSAWRRPINGFTL